MTYFPRLSKQYRISILTEQYVYRYCSIAINDTKARNVHFKIYHITYYKLFLWLGTFNLNSVSIGQELITNMGIFPCSRAVMRIEWYKQS